MTQAVEGRRQRKEKQRGSGSARGSNSAGRDPDSGAFSHSGSQSNSHLDRLIRTTCNESRSGPIECGAKDALQSE